MASSMALARGRIAASRGASVSFVPVKAHNAARPVLPVRSKNSRVPNVVVRATAEPQQQEIIEPSQPVESSNFIAVCLPEELPKGVRKEVEVDGKSVLLFWYRNEIFAIESRSPAEGAYSEGFLKAKFTQDFCIECTTTGSLFSLKDGSVKAWFPNNPVLRALTPETLSRPMEIYPVKMTQEAISVDVRGGSTDTATGGANTSLEGNNVFAVQPTVYFEGMDPKNESASVYADVPGQKLDPIVAITATVAVGAVAAAGSALAIYNENLYALAFVWVGLGGSALYVGVKYVQSRMAKEDPKEPKEAPKA